MGNLGGKSRGDDKPEDFYRLFNPRSLQMQLFNFYEPQGQEVPIVANLPHSGMFVPSAIAAQFTPDHLQALPNTDWHLDRLYAALPTFGITVLQATHSRYVVDLNRQIKESVFGNFWTAVIPEKTAFGQPIYQTIPSELEIAARVRDFYEPYHDRLAAIVQEKLDRFGKVYLLDLHSFLGLITDQVCLGNRNGQTSSEFLIAIVEQNLLQAGYQTVRNKVFTGGYITGHYGQLPGVEALQIEVRYPVYLDETQLEKPQPPDWDVPQFESAKKKFDGIFGSIAQALK